MAAQEFDSMAHHEEALDKIEEDTRQRSPYRHRRDPVQLHAEADKARQAASALDTQADRVDEIEKRAQELDELAARMGSPEHCLGMPEVADLRGPASPLAHYMHLGGGEIMMPMGSPNPILESIRTKYNVNGALQRRFS